MALTLHLGVIDLPYNMAPPKRRGRKTVASKVTTGDVAEWLENKYGIMDVFYHRYEARIASDFEESFAGSLESLMMGGPVGGNPFSTAESRIEQKFKDFLSTREAERSGIPGTPTLAALEGHSSRFKNRIGKRRPSFIDTALYQSSFKAWVD